MRDELLPACGAPGERRRVATAPGLLPLPIWILHSESHHCRLAVSAPVLEVRLEERINAQVCPIQTFATEETIRERLTFEEEGLRRANLG